MAPVLRIERSAITLSDDEKDQLYEFTKNAYLDPNKWPHLRALLTRIDADRFERARLATSRG